MSVLHCCGEGLKVEKLRAVNQTHDCTECAVRALQSLFLLLGQGYSTSVLVACFGDLFAGVQFSVIILVH